MSAFSISTQQAAALLMQPVEPLLDRREGVGIEHAEADVLELITDILHPHAPGERCVDVHGFLGDADPLVGIDMGKGAHIVQPVGELDQQHAHVLGHRQQELAQVLGLGRFLGDEIEPRYLGQSVDESGDLVPEFFLDLGLGCLGILNDIVKQGGGDGSAVELHLGENGGDFERMVEIGLTRRAFLAAMRLHGIDIGAVEQILIRAGVIGHDPLNQFELPHHALRCPLLPANIVAEIA